MAARRSKKPRPDTNRPGLSTAIQWDAGLLMIVLGAVCFTTALAFDTNIHGTFDLSKLAFLYGGVVLLVAGFVVRSVSSGELCLARTPLDWPVLATLAALALTTALSVDPWCSLLGAYKTYEGAVQIVAYLVLFYAACRLRRSEVVVVMGTVVLTAFGAGVYGLVQRLGHDPLGWSKSIEGRMIATFGNPVFFSMFVALAIPLAAGLALRGEKNPDSDRRALLWWVAATATAAVFAAAIYPAMQTYSGPYSASIRARVLALVIVGVAVCIALGRRLVLFPRAAAWSNPLRWAALALAVLCNVCLYWSRTLGVLAAVLAGIFAFAAAIFVIDRESFTRDRRKWVVLAACLVAVNLGFNLWPETSTVGRLSQLIVRAETGAGAEGGGPAAKELATAGSFYHRILLFRSGLNIIRDHPVLGVGPDAIERVIAGAWSADYQLRHGHLVEVKGFENRVHNELVEVAASKGMVGLAARLWLYAAFVLMLWRARNALPTGERAVLAGLAASWFVVVSSNLVEYPTIPISAAMWTLMGCTVAWVQNEGAREAWPARRVTLVTRPSQALVISVVLPAAVVLGWFWFAALHRPYTADRHFQTGRIHQARNQLDEAREQMGRAVTLNPRLHIYREGLTYTMILHARELAKQRTQDSLRQIEGLARDVIDFAAEGVRLDPWRANGYVLAATGRNLLADVMTNRRPPGDASEIAELRRQADLDLRTAVEVNPHNASFRLSLARNHLRHRRWAEFAETAVQTLRSWPRKKETPDLVLQAASQLIQAKDHEHAVQVLLAVEQLMPEHTLAKVYEGLAAAYWTGQQWAELEATARALQAHEPSNPDAYRFFAAAHLESGRLDEAEAQCRLLLEALPGDANGLALEQAIRQRRAGTAAAAGATR